MPFLETKAPLEAIWNGFEGQWRLTRSLDSNLPGFPRGTFAGTATFKPHNAFNGSSYLYHETGELTTDQGHKLIANRKYIFRYSPEDEKISCYFVKEDNDEDDVDYLNHELEFEVKDGRWIAKGDHLCGMDMYWSLYDFRLERKDNNSLLSYWGLRHMVKGPQKDYSSDTAYQR